MNALLVVDHCNECHTRISLIGTQSLTSYNVVMHSSNAVSFFLKGSE